MANPDAVGASGAPFTLDIERGKIREFARATGSRNPAYREGDHPPIPPTFLTTQAFWMSRESDVFPLLDFDWKRGLHAEQEYIFHGPPPRAGTRLTGQSRVAEIYRKQGRRGGTMTFSVIVTEFRDETGRLVAESRMTAVETAKPPSKEPKESKV